MDELTREFLIESQEGLDRMERCLTDLEERPQDTELLGEIFRSVHTIKGATGFLGFKRLERLAHAGENLLGLLRDGKLLANQPIITSLLQLIDALRGILHTIEINEHEGSGEDTELISHIHELQRVETSVVPATIGSLATSSARHAPPANPVSDPSPATESALEAASESGRPAAASTGDSTLRVDVILLNRMMNLVGELVLTRNQILQATSQNAGLALLSRRLDMVTADLRESVMKARMQPVSNVFSKFPRIIRDLSQTLNRKVRLVMEGQETGLDKTLLEAIKDPLTHAIRNSLDHGIEPPHIRAANGKDPEGTLKLRAYQESSHVIIEVSDDGAGIGVEKVRNKAIERGLITAERAAHLGDRALLQLIFLPGFSTAEAITNVSGRGVGMDVVRTNVEKIGGKVEIDSRPGKGTTLRLRIPLTLAVIPALIVRTLNQSFALPQGALSELVHVPAERAASSIEWMEGTPLYRLRGQLLPLIFLDRMLSPDHTLSAGPRANPAAANIHSHREHFIAVLDTDGRRFGLVVDGLADPEEIVVKPLSAVLRSIGLYSGATVLGNGDLALILDPGSIASRAGVSIRADEERAEIAAEEDDNVLNGSRYLLVEADHRRAAVPLNDVLRIERIPLSRIEHLGHRPVLNFREHLLPVEDSAGLLAEAQTNPDALITVVVCRQSPGETPGDAHCPEQPRRHVGIAVSHVLDVAVGDTLFEAGSQHPASGVTLLNDHITAIVNLESIAALSLNTTSDLSENSDWNQLSETLA